MIKKARVINLTICGILCLRRYGNNLQSPKQTPALVMKPTLVKPYLFEAMRMKRAKQKMRSIFLQSHLLNNRDSADPYSL